MKVELIAYTQWVDPEKDKNPLSIAEQAASVCYGSVPTDTYKIAKGCKTSGHVSPFEHVSFTFHISGVSRALLAQLSRHRHISLSVQSQRYCSYKSGFDYVNPFYPGTEVHDDFDTIMEDIADDYKTLNTYYGAHNEDARAVLPNACCTELYMTANARALIEISYLRTCCYDEKTEVLTDQGWKFFKDLNGDEIFYSLDINTQECKFTPAVNCYEYDYNGEMYRVNAQSIDLLITPNHNVLYSKSYDNKKWEIDTVENITSCKRILMKKNCVPIAGKIDKTIKLNDCVVVWQNQYKDKVLTNEYNGYEIDTPDFLKLLGFYLSDGYTSAKRRIVGFSKGSYDLLLKYKSILDKFVKNKTRIFKDKSSYKLEVEDIILYNFFKQFGNCYAKRIPEFVWGYDYSLLKYLYEGFKDGDFNKKGSCIWTSSKNMADDLQRLFLHLGHSASIKIMDRRGHTSSGFDKEGNPYSITTKNLSYAVTVNFSKNEPIIKTTNRDAISKEQYKGKIYCVELLHNHIMYVRRNGKAVWCGNSRSQTEIREMFQEIKKQVATVAPEIAQWMVPQCEKNPKYPFCTEAKSCGRHPKLSEVYKKE